MLCFWVAPPTRGVNRNDTQREYKPALDCVAPLAGA